MGAAPTVSIIVSDVPARLRRALVRDAQQRDVSVNHAAVAPLCLAYGVALPGANGRYVDVDPDQAAMTLRVPPMLRTRLRTKAAQDDATIRGLVIACLASHYGLPAQSTKRRPRS